MIPQNSPRQNRIYSVIWEKSLPKIRAWRETSKGNVNSARNIIYPEGITINERKKCSQYYVSINFTPNNKMLIKLLVENINIFGLCTAKLKLNYIKICN